MHPVLFAQLVNLYPCNCIRQSEIVFRFRPTSPLVLLLLNYPYHTLVSRYFWFLSNSFLGEQRLQESAFLFLFLFPSCIIKSSYCSLFSYSRDNVYRILRDLLLFPRPLQRLLQRPDWCFRPRKPLRNRPRDIAASTPASIYLSYRGTTIETTGTTSKNGPSTIEITTTVPRHETATTDSTTTQSIPPILKTKTTTRASKHTAPPLGPPPTQYIHRFPTASKIGIHSLPIHRTSTSTSR